MLTKHNFKINDAKQIFKNIKKRDMNNLKSTLQVNKNYKAKSGKKIPSDKLKRQTGKKRIFAGKAGNGTCKPPIGCLREMETALDFFVNLCYDMDI